MITGEQGRFEIEVFHEQDNGENELPSKAPRMGNTVPTTGNQIVLKEEL